MHEQEYVRVIAPSNRCYVKNLVSRIFQQTNLKKDLIVLLFKKYLMRMSSFSGFYNLYTYIIDNENSMLSTIGHGI